MKSRNLWALALIAVVMAGSVGTYFAMRSEKAQAQAPAGQAAQATTFTRLSWNVGAPAMSASRSGVVALGVAAPGVSRRQYCLGAMATPGRTRSLTAAAA